MEEAEAAVNRQLVNVSAVAGKLSCSTRHVYRLLDSGNLPQPRRLGALVRWDAHELDNWIEAGCPSVRSKGVKHGN